MLDGKTGFLVPANDLDALVKAIENIASLPAVERVAMGAAAYQLATSRYDFELMIKGYLQVYNEAIEALRKH